MAPRVELLYWPECPSHARALAQLREAMGAAGLPASEIDVRAIASEADAAAEHFLGSPTIRINGRDIQPAADDEEPYGLRCRIYRRRDGRISPTPDPLDISDALARAQPKEQPK